MTKIIIQSTSIKKDYTERKQKTDSDKASVVIWLIVKEDKWVQIHHLKTNLVTSCLIVSNSNVSEPFWRKLHSSFCPMTVRKGHTGSYTHALLSWESLLSDWWPEFAPAAACWPSFLTPIGAGTLGFCGGPLSGRGDSGGLWRIKWPGTGVLMGVDDRDISVLASLLSGLLSFMDSPVLFSPSICAWGRSPFGTTAVASFRPFFELPLGLLSLINRTSLSSVIVVAVNMLLCSPLLISSINISLFLLHLTIVFMELTRSIRLSRMDKDATPSMKLSIKVFSVGLEM